MSYDPKKVRVRDGWVVALADPRKEQVGLIHLAPNETGVEKVTEGMATIVRIGFSNAALDGLVPHKNSLLDLFPGDRICYRSYLRHANPIPCDEKWPSGEEKRYFILNSDDILAVLAHGVEVGVFSGRPQVPASKEQS